MTVLMAPLPPVAAPAADDDKKGKKKKDKEPDAGLETSSNVYCVGVDPANAMPLLPTEGVAATGASHRLLFFSAAADIEESFVLKKAMLRQCVFFSHCIFHLIYIAFCNFKWFLFLRFDLI